ncbi:TPA: hypothetical protein DIC40_03915 [Patescibacteria group bacterium]|nr:hypothetical protein P148_SR1C00001G0484 [candidate division SR1 bacterium RAAC1_SR1_1]HCY20982.1 hypothetical protein [Candidatus Gracilibacteria bacterium]
METKNKEDYYVTHIAVTDIPMESNKKLVFYTTNQKNEEKGKIFVRFNPVAFEKAFIEHLMQQGKAIKLDSSIPISKGKTLWLNTDGNVYLGEITENNKNLVFCFNYQEVIQARV